MMTHDEMIAVIQAHRDGKQIQMRFKGSSDSWADRSPRPADDFTFATLDYRVKPEPREPREFCLLRKGCGIYSKDYEVRFGRPLYDEEGVIEYIRVREWLP